METNSCQLKLCPYHQVSLARRRNEKLSPRFYGPFAITARVGPVAYHLCLPKEAAIHPVFHISQLRRTVGHGQGMGYSESEVLIRWEHLPAHDATWESYEAIDCQFPHFYLEDKVRLWGGGNDKPPLRFTYVRRRVRERNVAGVGEGSGDASQGGNS
ncbi:hypothetical protein L484_007617 [Morus notabilis]|uniref:Uncharacterized protein n=1 Tax=Morus notabilis TaxID=981085 RepID=W9RSR4_9ROSA|nr:hypothetical protein L484_007617 [Morus notabilis]